MDVFSSGRFWAGVVVGVIAVYAWHMYQQKKGNA